MGYLNIPGKINKNTWLIDATYKNSEGEFVRNGHAAYLIKTEDGRSCLINPGSRSGASSIYERLKRLKCWPLDMVIITHSHWDHTQGMIFFHEIAEVQKISPIKVLASEKAIPYLNNQSYNQCFVHEEYYSDHLDIPGVRALKDKQEIKLSDSFLLEIHETPGHMIDHISVYDKQNKAFFVGDAPGMHWILNFYVCNANSIYWEEKNYFKSIEKIRSFDLEYLCIAHFGVFTGEDISQFLDKSISMYYKWMKFFDQMSNKLENINFLLDQLWNTLYKDFSNMPIMKIFLKSAIINALKYYKNLKQV